MMAVKIVLVAVGGVIALLLLAPVSAHLVYNEKLVLCVRVLGLPVYRFPSSRQKVSRKKKSGSKPSETLPRRRLHGLLQQLRENGVCAVLEQVSTLAQIAKKAAGRVLRAVTVDKLVLHVTVASCDAATTAQDTGRVCAVLYPALTLIQSQVHVRQRDVTVQPDYLAETGRAQAELRGHTMPIRMMWAALCAAGICSNAAPYKRYKRYKGGIGKWITRYRI